MKSLQFKVQKPSCRAKPEGTDIEIKAESRRRNQWKRGEKRKSKPREEEEEEEAAETTIAISLSGGDAPNRGPIKHPIFAKSLIQTKPSSHLAVHLAVS